MTLRTRLTFWLLLLSVVPLGAVTVYSYVSSANALRDAAAREADLMAGELRSRMQLVTAELSARMEKLVTDPGTGRQAKVTPAATKTVAPAAANATPAKPAAAPAPNAPAAPAAPDTTVDSQVAEALGDAAVLLNSVELHGVRNLYRMATAGTGRFTGTGGAPMPGVRPGGPGGNANEPPRGVGGGGRRDFPGRGQNPNASGDRSPRPRPNPAEGTTSIGAPSTAASSATPIVPVAPGSASAPASIAPPKAPDVAAPAQTAQTPPGDKEDKFVVDLGAMARDLTKQFAPDGLDKLTPEERQRITREIGNRMMGVAEGIRIGAAEIARKAELAKQQAAERAKVTEAAHPAEPAADQPTETKSTLTGDKLNVTVARNGKVVHSASAAVNLDNLLMTVFSTTRHEQGEVPFAIGKDGKVYTQNAADRKTVQQLGASTRKIGTTVAGDWIIVTTADPSGSGLRFGIARPVGDSLNALRRAAGKNAGLGLLCVGLALIVVVPVSQSLARPIGRLTHTVGRIATGDFSARADERGPREVKQLASAVNKMATDIQQQQAQLLSQERLKRELELGRQIQSEMLPNEALRLGLTEVKGMSIPAREVGGDFFNYFALDNGQVALLVGDVSGKGVGAALLMANFQAALRTRLQLGHDLAAIADAIDRDVAATAPRGLYATLFMGILDPATRRLRYVNAGHNPQFAVRHTPSGTVIDRLSSAGTPIGLLPGHGYTQGEIQLAAGDHLFFYTDGVVETENAQGDQFGPERLERLLLTTTVTSADGPEAILRAVEADIKAFRGDTEPFDDATTMVVKIG